MASDWPTCFVHTAIAVALIPICFSHPTLWQRHKPRLNPIDHTPDVILRGLPEDFFEHGERCPVCRVKFRDSPNDPALPQAIPCGHIWCTSCIHSHMEEIRGDAGCRLYRNGFPPQDSIILQVLSSISSYIFGLAGGICLNSLGLYLCFVTSGCRTWNCISNQASADTINAQLPTAARFAFAAFVINATMFLCPLDRQFFGFQPGLLTGISSIACGLVSLRFSVQLLHALGDHHSELFPHHRSLATNALWLGWAFVACMTIFAMAVSPYARRISGAFARRPG